MRIVIIGHAGHGKTTLMEAIKTITGNQCIEMHTNDLVEVYKEEREKLDKALKAMENIRIGEMLDFEPVADTSSRRKKGKELKNWQRTKFYQR